MRALARVGRLFPRNQTVETVRTRAHFEAAPEMVWRAMLFYEQVPRRPGSWLRLFLPAPVRTKGDKSRVGAVVECIYEGGYLEKCITVIEPAHVIRFDVVVQRLGIEDSISMRGGSYEMSSSGDGTDVVLATRYCGHLRPRWLWRPLERSLAHGLHRHILDGMRSSMDLVAQAGARPALQAPGPA